MGPEVSALSRTLGEPHIYSGPLHVVWTSMYGIRVPPVPPALRAQDMHHPVCGLRRINLPRTPVHRVERSRVSVEDRAYYWSSRATRSPGLGRSYRVK